MSKKLNDRIALITGANRGIGRALSIAFANEGAHCILAGRNMSQLEELCQNIISNGGKAQTLHMDLGHDESIVNASKELAKTIPRLDIFIANAASLGARKPIVNYPKDTFKHTFQVNVFANLLLLQALDKLLNQSESAKVIFMSALVATQAKINTGSYAITKAALEALARIYMIEHQDSKISLNTVSPGATRTLMRAQAVPAEDPMTIKAPEAIVPLFVELCMSSCAKRGEWIDADVWLKSQK
jgi:NAD(P)-dependent dehydrogenase (short-subunit alcohol dehydrogenase family)